MNITKFNWNTGEISPLFNWRSDIANKYQGGSLELENFNILPYGSIQRRPGSKYLGQVKFIGRKTRLIPFQIDATEYQILEMGHEYIRFWKDDVAFAEIVTPYDEEDIDDIHFSQINDIIYLCHEKHPVQKLSRIAEDQWAIEEVVYTFPPTFFDNADDQHNLVYFEDPSQLQASKDTFEAAKEGEYFQLKYRLDGDSVYTRIKENIITESIKMYSGFWGFNTTGTWAATITIQYSDDDGKTWYNVEQVTANKDKNIQTEGEWTEEDIKNAPAGFIKMRLVISSFISEANQPTAQLFSETSKFDAVFRVDEVISSTLANVTVIKGVPIVEKEIIEWKKGAFNDVDGYPKAIAFFEQRICLAGTPKYPQVIWMSQTDDFENFLQGVGDSDAISLSITTGNRNSIQWLAASTVLAIGTIGSEHTLTGGDTGVTPTNFKISTQSTYGSRDVQAILVNHKLLFVQRNGRKLREFQYQFADDQWNAPDLTIFSEHVTLSGIKQMSLQRQKHSNLFTVLENGIIAFMTYDSDQNIYGWGKWKTDGDYESVAIANSDDYDKIYTIAKRTVDGNTVRYIERLDNSPDVETVEDMFYVDSGLIIEPTSETISIPHLEGKTVSIVADGKILNEQTVSSGVITLDQVYSKVIVGLKYTSKNRTVPFDAAWGGDDTRRNKYDRLIEFHINVIDTLGLRYGENGGKLYDIQFRKHTDILGTPTPLFTGQKIQSLASKHAKEKTVYLETDYPAPCLIVSLLAEYAGIEN